MNVVRPCHVVMFGQFDVGPFSSVGCLLISALYLFFRLIFSSAALSISALAKVRFSFVIFFRFVANIFEMKRLQLT